MPIKVRCKQCSAILTLSDKARGRAVKCRQCGGRVQVGTGKRRRPQQQPAHRANPDNLFGELDLRSAEDSRRRICPNCAKSVAKEDKTCPHCGVYVETGVLGEKERRRRSRNAPPSEEFYGAVWSKGWKFLMANRSWAIRTAIVWSMTFTLAILSAFTWHWYVQGREVILRESADGPFIEVTDDRVFIDFREDDDGVSMYDGKRYTLNSVGYDKTLTLPGPRMGAIRSPPSVFWLAMLLVSMLGFGGWAWTLAVEIVKLTLSGGKKIKRFHTDLFASMAIGFRSIFWPVILLCPLLWIPDAILYMGGSSTWYSVAWGCLLMIPLFTFLPPALIHMSQTYTYRAWLINWMTRDLVNTIVPAAYVSLLLFGLVLLIPLTCGALAFFFWDGVASFYATYIENKTLDLIGLGYDPENAGNFFEFTFYRFPLLGLITFLCSFVVWGLLAFPAIFMMRVYGMYGQYFRPDLSLINEQVDHDPAGFGPRFLAFLIDSILMTIMAGVAWFISIYVTKLFGSLYGFSEEAKSIAYLAMGTGSMLLLWAIYFCTWEAGQNRGTLGKASMGMMVLREDDSPMTVNQALSRAASALVTVATFCLGFVMCAFTDGHRALHDMMSKTKVVWRGEDEHA